VEGRRSWDSRADEVQRRHGWREGCNRNGATVSYALQMMRNCVGCHRYSNTVSHHLECVALTASTDGRALHHASKRLRGIAEVVRAARRSHPYAIQTEDFADGQLSREEQEEVQPYMINPNMLYQSILNPKPEIWSHTRVWCFECWLLPILKYHPRGRPPSPSGPLPDWFADVAADVQYDVEASCTSFFSTT